MKYLVTRTSDIFRENKPCDEAVLVGKDEDGHDIWEVEIATIEELMEFIKKYGKCVIAHGFGFNWIEI